MRAPLAPPQTIQANLVTNPNVELNGNGWYTNDSATSSFVRDTGNPISGSASMMSTRAAPNLATQGANGTFEGGNISGFVGSGAAPYAVIAADSSRAHTGTGCMKVVWSTQPSAGSQAAYINANLVVGQRYTAEAWYYVPVTPNLLTQGANGTFEGGVTTGWAAIGASPPTLAADATIKRSGSHSMRITWATAGSYESGAQITTGIPTVVGQQYTAEAWLYVPTGSPQASLVVAEGAFAGNIVTVKDQWVLSTVTFTATATTTFIAVDNRADATAGQRCYTDDVRLFTVASNHIAAQPYTRIDGGSSKSPAQIVTTPGVWTRSIQSFTATVASEYIYFPITGAPSVAGQTCYVDDVKLYVELDTTIGSNYIGNAGGETGIPVVVGQTYTHSIDLRAEQDNRRAISYFSWYDDAWAGKGDSSNVSAWTNLVNGVAARISHTATAPAGATKCLVIVAIYTIGGTGNALAGERAWWDNLRVSVGASGTNYFDGNTPGYTWTGTPNQSQSVSNPTVPPYSQWDGAKAIPLNGAWQTDAAGALVAANFAEVEVV